jgi:septal ring factor EnvC (AmiA/AmiB activator)
VSEPEQADSGERGDQAPLDGLREKVAARGEEALGRIAQDLLENPWVNSALAAAFEARGKASQAQEVAMDLLNLPSAAQIERLTRRVRSVSQRLEAIEDTLSRLEDTLADAPVGLAGRLDGIEQQLAEARRMLAGLVAAGPQAAPIPPGQERLAVDVPTPSTAP